MFRIIIHLLNFKRERLSLQFFEFIFININPAHAGLIPIKSIPQMLRDLKFKILQLSLIPILLQRYGKTYKEA